MTFPRKYLILLIVVKVSEWENWDARESDFLRKRLVANGSSMAYDHGWRWIICIYPFPQIQSLSFSLGSHFFPFPPSTLCSSYSIFIAFVSASASASVSAIQDSKEMASSHLYFSLSLLFLVAICTFHHQVRLKVSDSPFYSFLFLYILRFGILTWPLLFSRL